MSWNPTLNSLQSELAQLYWKPEEARRVAVQAGLDDSHIALEGGPINFWHNILEEALRRDKVDALIGVAKEEYSDSQGLARAVAAYSPVVELEPARPSEPKPAPSVPPPILHPSLVLVLAAELGEVDMGSQVTWIVTVRNDGDADLHDVLVRRGRLLLEEEPFPLAAGEERRLSFAETYPTAGVQTEAIAATGTASDGQKVTARVSGTMHVRAAPPLPPQVEVSPVAVRPEAKPAPDTFAITAPIRMEFVRVPAGKFLMGSDPRRDENAEPDEQPQHRLFLPEFYIGRYPVTNGQYAAFVKAVKRKTPADWEGGKMPSGREDHPVVNVTWHDALAFCRWLSDASGQAVRLPSEAEWEKAARWDPTEEHSRIYPWGDQWSPTKCNTLETGPHTTTPVGVYSPAGDSPCGAADMAGNVWEWTRSLWDSYPYDPDDGRENLRAPDSVLRVLRGGSWADGQWFARCAFRLRDAPDVFNYDLGFRLVVSLSVL